MRNLKKFLVITAAFVMMFCNVLQAFAAARYIKPEMVNTEAVKTTGLWNKNADGHWSFTPNGEEAVKDGWFYLNSSNTSTEYKWYCFDENGIMRTGWIVDKNDSSIWYYAGETKDSAEGCMITGWITDPQDGRKYYLDPATGIMVHGWRQIDGKWYYFGERQYADRQWAPDNTGHMTAGSKGIHSYGAMYVNEYTPDGYYVGPDGVWNSSTTDSSSSGRHDPVVKTYTVTFNMNGHGTAPGPQKVKPGSTISEPAPQPSAEGYIFGGWFKESACINRWNFASDKVTASITLFAKWSENDHITITYQSEASNKGTVSPISESLNPVVGTATGSKASPSDGYRFINWTDAAGNVVGTSGTFIPEKKDGKYVEETYTAYFDALIYKVTAQVQGSHGNAVVKVGDTEVAEAGTGENVTFTATPSEGYEFDCWEVVSGGINIDSIKTNNTITVTMPATALTLKAHFKAVVPGEYNIILEDNGHGSAIAKVGDNEVTSAAPDSLVSLIATPNEGYVFKEWSIIRGIESGDISDNTFIMPSKEVKIQAVFVAETPSMYNIILEGDGHGTAIAKVNDIEVTSAAPGSSVTLIATPNEGYVLKEWSIIRGIESGDISNNSFTMPSKEVKIKAIFVQKHPVKVPIDAIVVSGANIDLFKGNLDALAAKGTSLVIFEIDIFKAMNEDAVKSLIESLEEKGIASHIRIPVWYGDGKFIDPLTDPNHQVFRQEIVNERKEDIEKYLKLGFSGINLDMIRFSGNAENYGVENACNAINETAKQLSEKAHSVSADAVVSAMIMPEIIGDFNKSLYGQDVTALCKYLDVICPEIFKDQYGKDAEWIRSVTEEFCKQSSGTAVVTGVRNYNEGGALSYDILLNDAKHAIDGGAKGILIDQYGKGEIPDFNTLRGFNIILEDDGHGTAKAKMGEREVTFASPDAAVTLAATPNEGYAFKEWNIVRGLSNGAINDNTFTMPSNEVKIKAIFDRAYNINVQVQGHGSASATVDGRTATCARKDASVTLTATPEDGYELKGWTVVSGGVAISSNAFTMPENNVTVKAVFTESKTPSTWIPMNTVIADGSTVDFYPAFNNPSDVAGYKFAVKNGAGYTEISSTDISMEKIYQALQLSTGTTTTLYYAKINSEAPELKGYTVKDFSWNEVFEAYESSYPAKATGYVNGFKTFYQGIVTAEIGDVTDNKYGEDWDATPERIPKINGVFYTDFYKGYGGYYGGILSHTSNLPWCSTIESSAYAYAFSTNDGGVRLEPRSKMSGVVLCKSFGTDAPVKYNITLDNDGHGTAVAKVDGSVVTSAAAGETVKLTAAPSDGYDFESWEPTPNTLVIGTDNTFIMPECDVTVKANFEEASYYAVCIWDIIGRDGEGPQEIIFGPATGADYDSAIGNATEIEDDWDTVSANAKSGKAHEKYDTALNNGYIKKIKITLNNDIFSGTKPTGTFSTFHTSIKSDYRKWNDTYSSSDCESTNYATSRIRATLNGRDGWDPSSYAGVNLLDDSNCLLSCFPKDLQRNIVVRESDIPTNWTINSPYTINSYEKICDKLWLANANEIYGNCDVQYKGDEAQFEKNKGKSSISAYKVYSESGTAQYCWLRSPNRSYRYQAAHISSNGECSSYAVSGTQGISPFFMIGGLAPETCTYYLASDGNGSWKEDELNVESFITTDASAPAVSETGSITYTGTDGQEHTVTATSNTGYTFKECSYDTNTKTYTASFETISYDIGCAVDGQDETYEVIIGSKEKTIESPIKINGTDWYYSAFRLIDGNNTCKGLSVLLKEGWCPSSSVDFDYIITIYALDGYQLTNCKFGDIQVTGNTEAPHTGQVTASQNLTAEVEPVPSDGYMLCFDATGCKYYPEIITGIPSNSTYITEVNKLTIKKPDGTQLKEIEVTPDIDHEGTAIWYPSTGIINEDTIVTVSFAEKPSYSIFYDKNGATSGTAPTDSNKYITGDHAYLPDNIDLEKEGSIFAGWNTSPDGFGTHYDAGGILTIGYENVTLYAEWGEAVSSFMMTDTTVSFAEKIVDSEEMVEDIPMEDDITEAADKTLELNEAEDENSLKTNEPKEVSTADDKSGDNDSDDKPVENLPPAEIINSDAANSSEIKEKPQNDSTEQTEHQ